MFDKRMPPNAIFPGIEKTQRNLHRWLTTLRLGVRSASPLGANTSKTIPRCGCLAPVHCLSRSNGSAVRRQHDTPMIDVCINRLHTSNLVRPILDRQCIVASRDATKGYVRGEPNSLHIMLRYIVLKLYCDRYCITA